MAAVLIGRYAKLAGRENVIAGSDCGFGGFPVPSTLQSGEAALRSAPR